MADVLIRVQNVELFLEGALSKKVRDEIQETCSYVIPNFKFLAKYKQEQERAKREIKKFGEVQRKPWDGTITVAKRYYKGNGILRAPSGLLSYIREILEENGVSYSLRNERPPVIRTPGYSTPGLVLRDYQEEAINKALRRGRGVIKAATGAGKTAMCVAMAARASVFPMVFYVTSCDLLEQAYDQFRKYLRYNGDLTEIGRVGAGHCDVQPITVATVQSCQRALIGKYTKNTYDDYCADDRTKFTESQKAMVREMVHEAQFVTIDECQHVSAQTIQDILAVSHKAKLRFGTSASPWRDDGLDILIEACFGRRICDINASFLINSGYLIKPYVTFNHFNQDLGELPDWQTHYKAYVVENDERNQWIAERAAYHVARNRPTIVLVKWTSHADILKDLMTVETEILTSSGKSRKSPKKRKAILERMRSRDLMCVIGTSLLDEGVDVPSAGAGIFAGGGKSSTRELQRVGRFIRKDPADPDKQAAFIEEFHDHCKWLTYHAKARRKILSIEREFAIGDRRII